jgi:Zn-dependent protease
MWAAIATTGAWINLFNLMPVWQLDGNRGFAALSKLQRAVVAMAFLAAWAVTAEGLLILLCIVAATRIFDPHAPATPDQGALAQFVFLVLSLAIVFHSAKI